MSQVLRGLQHLLPVVSVQVDAAEHVQLGVHPVQPAFDQVWGGDKEHVSPMKDKQSRERRTRKESTMDEKSRNQQLHTACRERSQEGGAGRE